jgi:hypothetical protein
MGRTSDVFRNSAFQVEPRSTSRQDLTPEKLSLDGNVRDGRSINPALGFDEILISIWVLPLFLERAVVYPQRMVPAAFSKCAQQRSGRWPL